ncbi:MAG: 30S ribosome-binding factor RbfA [Alphaproteobacteria bacterium]|nr:30S ribosome-binding factor RbfA [Alphaproteobacteria bacterium]
MSRRGEQRQPTPRQLRVGEAIRHALAQSLERGEAHDPGLRGNPVTVTEVRVSPDLRNATAFVIPFGLKPGAAEVKEIVAALNRAAPFLRHRVAEAVRIKFAPQIVFRPDTTFDEAHRIGTLLLDPRVTRDLGRTPGGDEPDK